VKFTNATTYASGWKWDFGDGAASTEHSPTHTYYLPGTYTVKLTAAGPGGSVSKTASTPITVGAAPGVPVGTSCSSGSPSVALFGDQTLGTDDVSPLGVARAFSTTASGCGKVGALNVYLESNSTATRLILGLYSDAAGHPGLLLAQGSTSNPIAGALNTIPVFPTRVDTGEVYWIAILGTQTGDVHFHTKAGSCTAETSIEAHLTTLPSSWTTGTIEAACQLSAYGTSTP
jgi:PKD repeat protein